MEKSGQWQGFFSAMAAGMATKQTTGTVSDNRGNTADVVVTERDESAVRNARNARQNRQASNAVKASRVRDLSLPLHTLFKDKTVEGLVFFKKRRLKARIDFVLYYWRYNLRSSLRRRKNGN
jgi:hypothetical protein